MLTKDYEFNEATHTLTVFSSDGVKRFCKDSGIELYGFNYHTIIDNSMTDVSYLFDGCYSFNHIVIIPPGVECCDSMFSHCEHFNSPVYIPYGVISCVAMFAFCTNFNFPVKLPSSVQDCSSMFFWCAKFNQPVDIPESVVKCKNMFTFCEGLDQLITIPNLYLANERDISNEEFGSLIAKVVDYRLNPEYLHMFEECPKMQFNGVPVSYGGDCEDIFIR